MEALQIFIKSNPPGAELKRALAVQMVKQGYRYRQIRDALGVSVGVISNAVKRYEASGVSGLRSQYWGTAGYLSVENKQAVLSWLKQKEVWNIEELIEHVAVNYGVSYKSMQSYYALMQQGGFSWKQSHPTYPNKDAGKIEENKPKSWTYWCAGTQKSPVAKCG